MPEVSRPLPTLLGNRFITFNSIVRVNQIEITRDSSAGFDEAADHTPENVQLLRAAFAKGFPGGRMTWAFSWQALQDARPNYRAIRELVVGYHRQYGDDITFIPGGFFAPMYNTREQTNRDLHDGLQMVSAMVGGGYRPQSVIAGFLAAENLRFLAEEEDIHVCQGSVWSQYAIDNGDGDGSLAYPYYPSREHFCKPAQGPADLIDCVNLDGWTCDFLEARYAGLERGKYCSRRGLGPIETIGWYGPEAAPHLMLNTTAIHFDRGFALNNFAWVTVCWEVCLVKQMGHVEVLTEWLAGARERWPDTASVTLGEFGLAWRRHYPDNARLDYRFMEQGDGVGGSDENLELRWFMNRDFRLALQRDRRLPGRELVVDFTRYDLPAAEPPGLARNWSLMNRINQKGTRPQDRPVSLAALAPDDQALIARRYPELFR